jgi:hypothetical protein
VGQGQEMWTNPRTGKGWTDEEESSFLQVIAAGSIKRMEAIRLYRRMKADLKRALTHARERGEGKESVAMRFKGQMQGQNQSETKRSMARAV